MEIQDSCASAGDSRAEATGITSQQTLPTDIINSHILTKLDGPSLASISCLSREIYALCSEEKLWKNICNNTFPSTTDPLVRNMISKFSSGHRSFYLDTFPIQTFPIHHHNEPIDGPIHGQETTDEEGRTGKLIHAVDVRFGDSLVFSKVLVTYNPTGWSLSPCSSYDLIGPDDTFPIPGEKNQVIEALEEKLKLSWIIMDPKRKRAINVSSQAPVGIVHFHSTDSTELLYATVVEAAGVDGGYVSYVVKVDCMSKGEELHLDMITLYNLRREIPLSNRKRKDNLVILQQAMKRRRRAKVEIDDEKTRYGYFIRYVG